MSTFLQDILDQPAVLDNVLKHFTGKNQGLLEQLAGMISEYPRIVLTSMGSAYYSLIPMHYALSKIVPCVHLIKTSEALKLPYFPGTLYIIMSRSGESREIAHYSKLLKERGEPLVAITMTPESTLAKNAFVIMYNPAPFDGLICTKAYSTMVLIGLLVTSILNDTLNQELIDNLSHSFKWMEENKSKLHDDIKSIPWLGKSLTFISHGPGVGLAEAGSLWMEEGARIRASYTSIDEFRHGPIEQVDSDFSGVWIELDKNDTDIKYVDYMMQLGGKFISIKVDGDPNNSIYIPSFDLPLVYRIIPAAMPTQMIADQSATNRGHNAGEMRYVNWVIK
jgi:fructoselysine-6-P-deglycase FrlB-like protein